MSTLHAVCNFFTGSARPALHVVALTALAAITLANATPALAGSIDPTVACDLTTSITCGGPPTTLFLHGTFADTETLGGYIVVGNGSISSADATVTGIADPFYFVGSQGPSQNGGDVTYFVTLTNGQSSNGNTESMTLYFDTNSYSLTGVSSVLLCGDNSGNCGSNVSTYTDPIDLDTGNAATPEPSTFVMILGAPVLFALRRIRRA